MTHCLCAAVSGVSDGSRPPTTGLQEQAANRHKRLWLRAKGHRLKLGDTHPHTLESLNNLIDLYEARNKPRKAEEWRAQLQQTENMST
ncbi:MAG: hypothetical protein H8D56_26840 [Planctomycetes bacterium]|nr:hypothetical protein [Planctomycetota bacterium]